MRLTPVRKNIIRLTKQAIDRAYSRHLVRCRKMSLLKQRLWDGVDCAKEVDGLFPAIAGWGSTPSTISSISDERVRVLLHTLVRNLYTNDRERRVFEHELLADLREHAAEYELLSQMPPPKREYHRRGPRTLVERRADTVAEKVQEWERKLKYAKTKLAAYKKKQKYYQKKGAVAG